MTTSQASKFDEYCTSLWGRLDDAFEDVVDEIIETSRHWVSMSPSERGEQDAIEQLDEERESLKRVRQSIDAALTAEKEAAQVRATRARLRVFRSACLDLPAALKVKAWLPTAPPSALGLAVEAAGTPSGQRELPIEGGDREQATTTPSRIPEHPSPPPGDSEQLVDGSGRPRPQRAAAAPPWYAPVIVGLALFGGGLVLSLRSLPAPAFVGSALAMSLGFGLLGGLARGKVSGSGKFLGLDVTATGTMALVVFALALFVKFAVPPAPGDPENAGQASNVPIEVTVSATSTTDQSEHQGTAAEATVAGSAPGTSGVLVVGSGSGHGGPTITGSEPPRPPQKHDYECSVNAGWLGDEAESMSSVFSSVVKSAAVVSCNRLARIHCAKIAAREVETVGCTMSVVWLRGSKRQLVKQGDWSQRPKARP